MSGGGGGGRGIILGLRMGGGRGGGGGIILQLTSLLAVVHAVFLGGFALAAATSPALAPFLALAHRNEGAVLDVVLDVPAPQQTPGTGTGKGRGGNDESE